MDLQKLGLVKIEDMADILGLDRIAYREAVEFLIQQQKLKESWIGRDRYITAESAAGLTEKTLAFVKRKFSRPREMWIRKSSVTVDEQVIHVRGRNNGCGVNEIVEIEGKPTYLRFDSHSENWEQDLQVFLKGVSERA